MSKTWLFSRLTIILLISISFSCKNEESTRGTQEYIKEIEEWSSKRIENLKKENGWLNLVGLFWLNEGSNTFGSSEKNDLLFPENAPTFIGTFEKIDSTIIFLSNEKASVLCNGERVEKIEMKSDMDGDPTVLETGSLRWFLIKRGDKYGIRLRDLEARLVTEFTGIDRFPTNDRWKIIGRFVPYDSAKEIEIPTILGTVEKEFSPGKIEFSWENGLYSFSTMQAGKRFFIVFADLTSGEETYGAGRFLYVDAPDSNNNVIIDFNKAYNPPCAFTRFATCPLSPEENKLRVKITAGEKNFGDH